MEEKSILSAAAAFKGWIMGWWVLPMSPRWISAILPCQEPFEESGSRWAQDGYQQSKPIPDKNLSKNLVQLKPLKEHFALLKKTPNNPLPGNKLEWNEADIEKIWLLGWDRLPITARVPCERCAAPHALQRFVIIINLVLRLLVINIIITIIGVFKGGKFKFTFQLTDDKIFNFENMPFLHDRVPIINAKFKTSKSLLD